MTWWVLLAVFAISSDSALGLSLGCDTVDGIETMRDFDMEQYLGRWYEVKRYPQIPATTKPASDVIHMVEQIADGEYSILGLSRSSNQSSDLICEHRHMPLLPYDGSKMQITNLDGDGKHMPYWVIYTDYTRVTLVYGCVRMTPDMTCAEAWARVYSRDNKLYPSQEVLMDKKIKESICLDETKFTTTVHKKDCQDCRMTGFSAQTDFDTNKFLGKWYRVKWIQPYFVRESYTDYSHNYTTETNNATTLVVTAEGRRNNGNGPCTKHEEKIYTTSVTGELEYERTYNDTATIQSPYWIIATDYTNYALVYGCRKVDKEDVCVYNMTDAWLWSRQPALARGYEMQLDELLSIFCLDPSRFQRTEQTKECKEEISGVGRHGMSKLLVLLVSWIVVRLG